MFKRILPFIILFILTTVAFSKIGYNKFWDLSQNKINTLSTSSQQLLSNLDAPLNIDIYSPNIDVINACNEMFLRYTKYSSNINVAYHETILDPMLSSKLKVLTDHNIVVTYKNRSKAIDIKVHNLTEEIISNLIQQTLKDTEQWVAFVTGHNEPDPFNTSELGLSSFSKSLQDQGMHIAMLNLTQENMIPDNTNLLIIANPQVNLLATEKELIHKYLASGKNLLWFTEPDSPATDFLNSEFGLQLSPGIAIDPESIKLGSPHPALKIITQYPAHAINNDFSTSTIMPWSGNLVQTKNISEWKNAPFLTTNSKSWTYSGPATQDLTVLAQNKDINGPLTIGLSLTKELPQHAEQRVIVIADSSFMLNKYAELFTNTKLTSNMVNWLQANTASFVLTPHEGKDFSYAPNKLSRFLHNVFFPFIFPMGLVVMGFYLQRR